MSKIVERTLFKKKNKSELKLFGHGVDNSTPYYLSVNFQFYISVNQNGIFPAFRSTEVEKFRQTIFFTKLLLICTKTASVKHLKCGYKNTQRKQCQSVIKIIVVCIYPESSFLDVFMLSVIVVGYLRYRQRETMHFCKYQSEFVKSLIHYPITLFRKLRVGCVNIKNDSSRKLHDYIYWPVITVVEAAMTLLSVIYCSYKPT